MRCDRGQVRWLPQWPLFLALTLFLPGPVIGQGNLAGTSGAKSEMLWHQSSALFPIQVYLPEDFDSERSYPAVIALHGFGGSSERMENIGTAFARGGFIVAVPEGPYPVLPDKPGRHSTWELSTWTEEYGLGPPLTDDPAIEAQSSSLTVDDFFPSVIDRVREQYRVGPIYVFGFSLGGVYALVNGFHNRDQVDGIITFGATYYRELFTTRGDGLEDGNRLKIRWVLGRSDPMVPFSNAERARDAFEEAGYEVVLDGFDGGHTVSDDALMRAVTWLRDLANAPAQTDQSRSLRDFVDDYEATWQSHDAGRLAGFFAEDADMIVGIQPTIVGREAIEAWWNTYFSDIDSGRELSMSIESVRVLSPDLALINVHTSTAGSHSGTKESLEPRKARGTWVVTRVGDAWKITALRAHSPVGKQRLAPGTDD